MDDPSFERALAQEIMGSELVRVRVLAATLAVLLALDLVMFALFHDAIATLAVRPVPGWIPLAVIGPFLLFEVVVAEIIRRRMARKATPPKLLRYVNAAIETSLPTAILWTMTHYLNPTIVFGTWPELLYFVFIIASTLRLDFTLSVFTGLVGSAGYLAVATLAAPDAALDQAALSPIYHTSKAGMILLGGIVAGMVAVRLRNKFRRAFDEATARERVTNVFGQHVSPAVVDKLLAGEATEGAGETRDICVVFLDIRNFTAGARQRPPAEVVDFLNAQFAYMIEAIDRHGGFINKFLGDGFMAVFGAPLDDPKAAENAVAACRDILAEIERRGLGNSAWPLRVGLGIHAGPAVVGNVGSPRRKEFTVIGDTVNLASRLEQLTKEHGARLIVSEAVMRRLGDGAASASPLADVTVKGYDKPIRVWRLA